MKTEVCKCLYPLIRYDGEQEYCGICEKPFEKTAKIQGDEKEKIHKACLD